MTSNGFTDGDLRGHFINRSFLDVSKRIFKANNLLSKSARLSRKAMNEVKGKVVTVTMYFPLMSSRPTSIHNIGQEKFFTVVCGGQYGVDRHTTAAAHCAFQPVT